MVDEARILVRVQPNANRNEVIRLNDGALHLRIAAPPVKGKANQELIKFLSEILEVSKANVAIIKGATRNRKVVGINRLTERQVMERLEKIAMREKK